MDETEPFRKRSWAKKFRDAFRGLKEGVRRQSSFFVHFFVTAVVIVTAAALEVNHYEWCLLLLCVIAVMVAEMFNSALESMARAVTDQEDPKVGRALDIGSAAVLIASIGAAILGMIIFLNRLEPLIRSLFTAP